MGFLMLYDEKNGVGRKRDRKAQGESHCKDGLVWPHERHRLLTEESADLQKLFKRYAKKKVMFDKLRGELVSGRRHEALDKSKNRKVHSIDRESFWVEGGWLYRHGKIAHRQEKREQFCHMKKWFGYLDTDGSGGVGAKDLLDPLVSLGLAKSKDEVAKLVHTVTGGETEMSFEDFVSILVTSSKRQEKAFKRNVSGKDRAKDKLASLFRNMWDGELSEKELSFPVLLTAHRRRKLFDANCAPKDSREHQEGLAVMECLLKLHPPERHTKPVELFDRKPKKPSVSIKQRLDENRGSLLSRREKFKMEHTAKKKTTIG